MHTMKRTHRYQQANARSQRLPRKILHSLWALALIAGAPVAANAAPSCTLPAIDKTTLADPKVAPEKAGDGNIPGIVADPQPETLDELESGHRTTRIVNAPSTNPNIPGGVQSSVAVDGDMYKNVVDPGRDVGSSTAAESEDLSDLVEDMNAQYGSFFVAAHLVHHYFLGNFSGGDNFTPTHKKTNTQMSVHGEKVAEECARRIYENFYKGAKFKENFLVKADVAAGEANLYYKPGFIYQSDAGVTQSVFDHDSTKPSDDLKLMPSVDDAHTQQMPSEVTTRIRFILHEYREDTKKRFAGGRVKTDYVPTTNWYYMPDDMFTNPNVREQIFDTDYATEHGLPNNGPLEVDEVEVTVTDQGNEITFSYLNQQENQ